MLEIAWPIAEELAERTHQAWVGVGHDQRSIRGAAIDGFTSHCGVFAIVAVWHDHDGTERTALVRGDVADADAVPVYLHTAWMTGNAVGPLHSDDRASLDAAIATVRHLDRGIVLAFRTTAPHGGGHDAADAPVASTRTVGVPNDERVYAVAADMLKLLSVHSITLMTTTPRMVEGLAKYGVVVCNPLRSVS